MMTWSLRDGNTSKRYNVCNLHPKKKMESDYFSFWNGGKRAISPVDVNEISGI